MDLRKVWEEERWVLEMPSKQDWRGNIVFQVTQIELQ